MTDSIPDAFFGRFKVDRSENFDEFLSAKGVGFLTRQIIKFASVTKVCRLFFHFIPNISFGIWSSHYLHVNTYNLLGFFQISFPPSPLLSLLLSESLNSHLYSCQVFTKGPSDGSYTFENLSSKKNVKYDFKLGESFTGEGLDGTQHEVLQFIHNIWLEITKN